MNSLLHVFLWGLLLDSLIGLIDKDKCTIIANWNSSKHFTYYYLTFGMQKPTLQKELSEHELSGLKLVSDLTMWWLPGRLQRMGRVLSEVSWRNLFLLQQCVYFYPMVNLTIKKL